jgi:hypothetical protein
MSHDNRGAPGDRDVPYVPLRTPNLAWPYPFTEREYVRLCSAAESAMPPNRAVAMRTIRCRFRSNGVRPLSMRSGT